MRSLLKHPNIGSAHYLLLIGAPVSRFSTRRPQGERRYLRIIPEFVKRKKVYIILPYN